MSAVLRALGPFITVAVLAAGAVADEWRVRRGRSRVKAELERETARHIGGLVPAQRVPVEADPAWWEFIPTRQDGEQQ